jgi:hypothetical protein
MEEYEKMILLRELNSLGALPRYGVARCVEAEASVWEAQVRGRGARAVSRDTVQGLGTTGRSLGCLPKAPGKPVGLGR